MHSHVLHLEAWAVFQTSSDCDSCLTLSQQLLTNNIFECCFFFFFPAGPFHTWQHGKVLWCKTEWKKPSEVMQPYLPTSLQIIHIWTAHAGSIKNYWSYFYEKIDTAQCLKVKIFFCFAVSTFNWENITLYKYNSAWSRKSTRLVSKDRITCQAPVCENYSPRCKSCKK